MFFPKEERRNDDSDRATAGELSSKGPSRGDRRSRTAREARGRGGPAEATLRRLLDREDTAFLHVRFPTYGCFALRVERQEPVASSQ
ncbi:MAG: DUF1203 domain-containing protein [Thermoanaerobaculia bacterium]